MNAHDPATYDRDGVLADILEPDELEGAVALTVDTLRLVLANDDVLQSSALVEDEHGVGVLALALLAAGTRATVILGPLTVEDLTGLDLDDGLVRVVGGGGGNAALVTEAGKSGGHADHELRQAGVEDGRTHGCRSCKIGRTGNKVTGSVGRKL